MRPRARVCSPREPLPGRPDAPRTRTPRSSRPGALARQTAAFQISEVPLPQRPPRPAPRRRKNRVLPPRRRRSRRSSWSSPPSRLPGRLPRPLPPQRTGHRRASPCRRSHPQRYRRSPPNTGPRQHRAPTRPRPPRRGHRHQHLRASRLPVIARHQQPALQRAAGIPCRLPQARPRSWNSIFYRALRHRRRRPDRRPHGPPTSASKMPQGSARCSTPSSGSSTT